MKSNLTILQFIDTKIEDGYFIRRIGNRVYHIKDNKITNVETIKKVYPIKPTLIKMVFDNKFITMDIETLLIDNTHIPYLIAFYTGKNFESFIIDNKY